jgi:hypothetical protein
MFADGGEGKPWDSADERVSKLVFIGRDLDTAQLRAGFEPASLHDGTPARVAPALSNDDLTIV